MAFWLTQYLRTLSKKNEFGVPIANFGRVNETMYRGARPSPTAYSYLRALGIELVIDLSDSEEANPWSANRFGMRWVNIPLRNNRRPEPEKIERWLSYVGTATIFVHCEGGRHRTGLAVACYWVRIWGRDKQSAWKEAEKYGWYSMWGHAPLKDYFFNEF